MRAKKEKKVPADFALRNLLNQGTAYQKIGEYEKALEFTTKALDQSREADNAEIEAMAFATVGNIRQGLRQYDEAVTAFQAPIYLYASQTKNETERINMI